MNVYTRWNVRNSILFLVIFLFSPERQWNESKQFADDACWLNILFRNSVSRERKRCSPHNYCIGLDSFTFHLKDDWWLHNYAICSLQMNKVVKRAEEGCALCKATDADHRISALRCKISCVIRHSPCSRWFQDVGKCSKQNEVDTEWGGGGGGKEKGGAWIKSSASVYTIYCFIVYIMFIMGNRTIYIYIIAEEWLREKVCLIKPKWK